MSALLKPDAFWLIVANLLLGLMILSCFAFLAASFVNDLRLRSMLKKEVARIPEDHLSALKDLGITILSEGRAIDEMEHQM
jgi:hypothetical protein